MSNGLENIFCTADEGIERAASRLTRTARIAISVEGETLQIHAASSMAGYLTLCGLDGGLSDGGQEVVDSPARRRINCPDCFRIWHESKALRRSDFSATLFR